MKSARTMFMRAAGAAFIVLGVISVTQIWAYVVTESANGHGTLPAAVGDNGRVIKRQFSFSAHRQPDGTVRGNAVLHNPAFDGAHGNQPYQLQIEISCMKQIGNIAFFGGTTRRTTDPNLVDAVYFSVQDNGEPGRNVDMISRAFFFDDDPSTEGDPQLCLGNQVGDFPMEVITSGNIQVRQ